MKILILAILYLHACLSMISQNVGPSIKLENLKSAQFITEINPEFWRLALGSWELKELEKQKKLLFTQGYYLYPQENNYNDVINYHTVEILTSSMGRTVSSTGTSDRLTAGQRQQVALADPGSQINIRLKFKPKYPFKDIGDKIITREVSVTALPDKPAVYPGGQDAFAEYLDKNYYDRLPGDRNTSNPPAIVRFTINEKGKVENAVIYKTSTDPEIDRLLLEAVKNMPVWKPAENAEGKKIKQEFRIPFIRGC